MDAQQIVAIYCICDDILKGFDHAEDNQRQMSDAEVMTTSLVAALFFGGNMERSRVFLQDQVYIPHMLEKSWFNRCQHKIAGLFLAVFDLLGEVWKALNSESVYIVDSFPISVCDNYRIMRCKIYHGEQWRGYQASKKRYYYGLKIPLMVTLQGQPIKFFLTPGSWSDTPALKMYNFDLREGSLIIGDKACNDYEFEDILEVAGLDLEPLRKKNSLRPAPPWINYLMSCYRKMVETSGSLIEQLLPKHIHAVPPQGFTCPGGLGPGVQTCRLVLTASFNSI